MGAAKNWDREDVKSAVRKGGTTLTAIAKNVALHKSSLTQCLDRPLPTANAAIAASLGKPLAAIWPEWFDRSGKRKTGRDASRTRRPRTSRNPENARRAN